MTVEESQIDVEQASARVSRILGGKADDSIIHGAKPTLAPHSEYSTGTVTTRPDGSRQTTYPEPKQLCPECDQELALIGRNRLSNCGHMRRSKGEWVPSSWLKQPPQPPAPAAVPGAITQEQKDRLVELILIRDARKQDMEAAEAEYEDSNRAMVSFLDALTGK